MLWVTNNYNLGFLHSHNYGYIRCTVYEMAVLPVSYMQSALIPVIVINSHTYWVITASFMKLGQILYEHTCTVHNACVLIHVLILM